MLRNRSFMIWRRIWENGTTLASEQPQRAAQMKARLDKLRSAGRTRP